jgi:hypothetical protein
MSVRFYRLPLLVALSIITVVAVTMGLRYNWPDYVHDRHGLPLTWGTHTLNTIQGPVDIWAVNTLNLTIDLVIWLGLMVLSQLLANRGKVEGSTET